MSIVTKHSNELVPPSSRGSVRLSFDDPTASESP